MDVDADASGLLLAWRICRAVKMHGGVVETTSSMTLSRSIREMDTDTGVLDVHPEESSKAQGKRVMPCPNTCI